MHPAGSFECHNAGRMPGEAHDLFVFTCWNPQHTGCGCHVVRAPEVAGNRRALARIGYTDRAGQRWDYARNEWVAEATR